MYDDFSPVLEHTHTPDHTPQTPLPPMIDITPPPKEKRAPVKHTTNIGLVSFGSTAAVASGLTATTADLLSSFAKVTWQKGSTNTAQALGVTRSLLENGRPTAKQVVIVVTDGMPESAFLTGVEVGRLKEQGARISFVAVGSSVSRHVLQRWASWPWEENTVSATSFGDLDSKKVTDVVTNICGSPLVTA